MKLRNVARNVAKTNMKKVGMTRICKNEFFAKNWRDWVHKGGLKK